MLEGFCFGLSVPSSDTPSVTICVPELGIQSYAYTILPPSITGSMGCLKGVAPVKGQWN